MAINTTQVLIRTIYADQITQASQDEDIQGLAKDVCEECIRILKEPEKSQAKYAIKVICAFVSTTRMSLIHNLVLLLISPRSIHCQVYARSSGSPSRWIVLEP